MPSTPRSIRFADHVWDLIAYEAQELGISTAGFVRISAVSCAVFHRTRRGGEFVEGIEELYAAATKALGDEAYRE